MLIPPFLFFMLAIVTSCPYSNRRLSSDDANIPTNHPSIAPSQLPTMLPSELNFLPPPKCQNGTTQVVDAAVMNEVTSSIRAEYYELLESYDIWEKLTFLGVGVRIPWHDAAEGMVGNESYPLGPDGCISTSPENFGLLPRDRLPYTLLEPIWQKYCTQISRGDFWAYWGKLTNEYAALPEVIDIPFYWGRIDNPNCEEGQSRLPNGTWTGFEFTKQIFVTQLGLTIDDAATLLGGHSVGRVFVNDSGFGFDPANTTMLTANSWDATPLQLDNQYYIGLLLGWQNWIPDSNDTSKSSFRLQSYQFAPQQNNMLNGDFNIAYVYFNQTLCPSNSSENFGPCSQLAPSCGGANNTCPRVAPVQNLVDAFAANNTLFTHSFAKSYVKLVNVNYNYSGMDPGWHSHLGALQGPLVPSFAPSSSSGAAANTLTWPAVLGICIAVVVVLSGVVGVIYHRQKGCCVSAKSDISTPLTLQGVPVLTPLTPQGVPVLEVSPTLFKHGGDKEARGEVEGNRYYEGEGGGGGGVPRWSGWDGQQHTHTAIGGRGGQWSGGGSRVDVKLQGATPTTVTPPKAGNVSFGDNINSDF